MGTFFKWLGGTFAFVVVVIFLFWLWTEVKYDKSAVEYVQDEWGWFGGKDNTETTENEVTIESDDGSVEATASINF